MPVNLLISVIDIAAGMQRPVMYAWLMSCRVGPFAGQERDLFADEYSWVAGGNRPTVLACQMIGF